MDFQTFFTAARLDEFWHNVKWFLFFVAPLIMIVFATDVLGWLIPQIRSLFDRAADKDDDDDIEVYRY